MPPTAPITKKPKTLYQATLFVKAPPNPIIALIKAVVQDAINKEVQEVNQLGGVIKKKKDWKRGWF
jgi:hypothetical protein